MTPMQTTGYISFVDPFTERPSVEEIYTNVGTVKQPKTSSSRRCQHADGNPASKLGFKVENIA